MATASAKRILRKEMTSKLKLVSSDDIASQSEAITERVVNLSWFKNARNISCFLSTPTSEVQTDALIQHAFANGKSVFAPFCPLSDPTVMKMLRLSSLEHFHGLKPNRWGIREFDPSEVDSLESADDKTVGGLDLILVPGLAFDLSGQRLGHGRGYYDRYISATQDYPSRFSGKPPPFTVALALREQILPEGEKVPTSGFDRLPGVIVTPDGELRPDQLSS